MQLSRGRGFNPRAREGRDARQLANQIFADVSIHAPARGATLQRLQRLSLPEFQSTRPRGARPTRRADSPEVFGVSIHAPARGATLSSNPQNLCGVCFNPRAREGRDNHVCPLLPVVTVSIHAPARGATDVGVFRAAIAVFQSTRPRGARPKSARVKLQSLPFQSTRPRGARLDLPSFCCCYYCVSIHAPARGATSGCG